MKRVEITMQSARIALISLLFVSCGISLCTKGEVECCEFDLASSNESSAPMEQARFNSDELAILREHLPILYSHVASPEWDITSGLDKQRIAAEATLTALGADTEDLGNLLDRLERLEVGVPPKARKTVAMSMGIVGESLIDGFIWINQEKQTIGSITDAFSFLKKSSPDEFANLFDCLNRGVEKRGKVMMLLFRDWTRSLEVSLQDTNGELDPAMSSVLLSAQLQKNLVGDWTEVGKDYRLCVEDVKLSSGDES